MIACIALWILVTPPSPESSVVHEHHRYIFCEAGGYLPDEQWPGTWRSECEIAANKYVTELQYLGILPGANEVISYRAICTNGV